MWWVVYSRNNSYFNFHYQHLSKLNIEIGPYANLCIYQRDTIVKNIHVTLVKDIGGHNIVALKIVTNVEIEKAPNHVHVLINRLHILEQSKGDLHFCRSLRNKIECELVTYIQQNAPHWFDN